MGKREILNFLSQNGPSPVKAISEGTGTDLSSTYKILKELQKGSYVLVEERSPGARSSMWRRVRAQENKPKAIAAPLAPSPGEQFDQFLTDLEEELRVEKEIQPAPPQPKLWEAFFDGDEVPTLVVAPDIQRVIEIAKNQGREIRRVAFRSKVLA